MSSHNKGLRWAQLCKHFTFIGTQNDVEAQKADFEVVASHDLNRQIRAFASMFENHLRQSALAERRRYHSREDYAFRAKTWIKSKSSDAENKPSRDQKSKMETMDQARVRRNLEMRALVAKNATLWSGQSEETFVFTEALGRRANCDVNYSIDLAYRRIEHWSTPLERGEERKKADILKLLILSASDPSAPAERSQDTHDKLFMLLHHAGSGFQEFLFLGDSCCNISQGLQGLLQRTLQVYIYLNMLSHWCASDLDSQASSQASTAITRMTTDPPLRWDIKRWRSRLPHVYQPNPDGVLIPRPIFMNFASWSRLIYDSCRQHEYLVEGALFRRHFWSAEELTDPLDHNTPSRKLLNLSFGADWQSREALRREYYFEQAPVSREQNPLSLDFLTSTRSSTQQLRRGQAPFSFPTQRTKLFLHHLFRILRLLEMLWQDSSRTLSESKDRGALTEDRLNWEFAFLEALNDLKFKKNNRLFNDKWFWEFVDSVNHGYCPQDDKNVRREHSRQLQMLEPWNGACDHIT